MLNDMDFANLFVVQSHCTKKRKKRKKEKKTQLKPIHRLSSKFRSVNIDNKQEWHNDAHRAETACSVWLCELSLLLVSLHFFNHLDGDCCSSEFRLGLSPLLCDMAVSYILCQPFCRKKYRNLCTGHWWKMCCWGQTFRYVGTMGLSSPFFWNRFSLHLTSPLHFVIKS